MLTGLCAVCCVASASLATFGHEETALGNILIRISLEGKTASAAAVLQALLAFSSLHRFGLQPQAVELKIAALRSLAKGSAAASLGAKETIQHIATGMLLCSFEVHQSSCSSDEWMGFLSGVETVVNASSIDTLLQLGSDVVVLLDWVHYHDVLARFSLLYWEREGTPELPSTPTNFFGPQVRTRQQLHNCMTIRNVDLTFDISDFHSAATYFLYAKSAVAGMRHNI